MKVFLVIRKKDIVMKDNNLGLVKKRSEGFERHQ